MRKKAYNCLKNVRRFAVGTIAAILMFTATRLPSATEVDAASKVVTLNHTEKTLNVGDKLILKAKITRKGLRAKKQVWKSNKAAVASVSQKGVVKAKKAGVVKITVMIKGTPYKATCSVNVKNKEKTDAEANYTVETKVRLDGDTDKTWKKSVDAKIGDIVEFQINYKNTSSEDQRDVAVDDQLPANLRYVPGSTRIMNGANPNGATFENDDIYKNGIWIGSYGAGANALIRFKAEVVDETFTCGLFTLRNWGRVGIGTSVIQDSADVNVQLEYCTDPITPNPATLVDSAKKSTDLVAPESANSYNEGIEK